MRTNDWQPKRGDPVRIRATGETATAMKIAGNLIRVHYDPTEDDRSPQTTKPGAVTPVHRASLRPPAWFEVVELEPATP